MKINSTFFTILLALIIVGPNFAQSPNVIIIIADDMGWSQTSSTTTSLNNPSDFYETPIIDQLANEGIAFPNAYVNGANCAPTRAAILSGQWASRPTNNVFAVNSLNRGGNNTLLVGPSQGLSNGQDEIPASAITIAETVKTSPANYVTAHFGKYHSGGSQNNDPLVQGFDFNFGGQSDGAPGSYFASQSGGVWEFSTRIGPDLDPYANPYTSAQSIALAGDNSLQGTAKHVTDAMGDAAIDFMNANNSSPFFMHFSNYAIHGPWGQANARPDLYAKYVAKNNSNPSQMGHNNVAQAAILEGMDQTVGRLIDYLKTTPDPRNPGNMLAANTLVYFLSDNGGANGPEDNVPLKGMKGEYTEGGIRSVSFAWSQGLLANMGQANNTPIQAFDLYPTLAEMTGAALPTGYDVDGVSLWSMLNGSNSNLNRDALFWHFPGYIANNQRDQRPVTVIRKNEYKLTYFYETETYELYNLNTDIGETTNLLAGTPSNAILTIANDMSTDLRNHLVTTAAPLPTFRNNGQTVPLPEVITAGGGGNPVTSCVPTTYQALWNFDTAVGTNDVGGNHNALSITGSVSYDTSDFKEGDQSLVLDGATKIQYSANTGTFMLEALTARSVTMWIKPTSLTGIQELYDEGGAISGVTLRLNGNTIETLVRNTTTSSNQVDAVFPNDGDWHHVALVYNGAANRQSIFIDGVLATTNTNAPSIIPARSGIGGIAGIHGRDSFTSNLDSFFTGKMDAVAVYNISLSADEVREAACLEPDTGGECTESVIDSQDFESGLGIWQLGGSDARRNSRDAAYANSGSFCVRLRDNTNTSVVTTGNIDASGLEKITVDFSYFCRSMDNVNEDFWLQISTNGGTSFTTVEEWNLNDEFVNNQRYNDSVEITGPFTATTRIRFRADASGNSDWVYLDDIVITGCGTVSSKPIMSVLSIQEVNISLEETASTAIKVFPNPFKEIIKIDLTGKAYKVTNVEIYNISGQMIHAASFYNNETIKLSNLALAKGQYFAKVVIDGQITIKQMIKQ